MARAREADRWPPAAKAQVLAAALGNQVIAAGVLAGGVLGALKLRSLYEREPFRPFSGLKRALVEIAAADKPETRITVEGDRFDAPVYQAPRFEAPRYEAPRFEAPTFVNAPSFAAPTYNGPSWVAPSSVAPSPSSSPAPPAPPWSPPTSPTSPPSSSSSWTAPPETVLERREEGGFPGVFTPTPWGIVTGGIRGGLTELGGGDGGNGARAAGEFTGRAAVGGTVAVAEGHAAFMRGAADFIVNGTIGVAEGIVNGIVSTVQGISAFTNRDELRESRAAAHAAEVAANAREERSVATRRSEAAWR